MRRDEKNRYVRLNVAQVGDDLKAGGVRQKKIDDAQFKTPLACLINSLLTFGHQHYLVAVRLEHKLERIAYGWLVINDKNTYLLFDVRHNS